MKIFTIAKVETQVSKPLKSEEVVHTIGAFKPQIVDAEAEV